MRSQQVSCPFTCEWCAFTTRGGWVKNSKNVRCVFFADWAHFEGNGCFLCRKKTPEAAAGHNTLVLRKKIHLASIANECMDRTSRRAEIPPPEEAALRAAPQRGATGIRFSSIDNSILRTCICSSFFDQTKIDPCPI